MRYSRKRNALIYALIDDFLRMFPNANRATQYELFLRLDQFDERELEILLNAGKNQQKSEEKNAEM